MPSAMGLLTRLAYARAKEEGVPVRSLLRRCRLTTEHLEDSRTRIPARAQIDFLNLAADALGDDLLGFNLAMDFDLRQAGLMYYIMASSQNLREVFERGARFSTVVNDGVSQRFIDGRHVGLAVQYTVVKRQADRHQLEFWLALLVRICRQVTGIRLEPIRVRMSHFRERGHARMARYLGPEVEFGAAVDEILFARETRDLPLLNADPYLSQLLIDFCEEALSRRGRTSGSFAARVENTVAPLLPHGDARADEVARRLGLSQRTFARRLAEEGLTFSVLLDQLRLELAKRYLVKEKIPVSKVAWLLGYKEVGAFSHAFRRWTGKSPSEVAARKN